MDGGAEGGHKSATLTRQNKSPNSKPQSTVCGLAKVSSSVELAVLGYNTSGYSTVERDRCINAVIVSPLNRDPKCESYNCQLFLDF